jgi:ABC-type multidrug transport system fused ATPase/permease subunit
VLRFVLMTVRRLVSGSMAVSIEYDLRNVAYSHLQRLSFSFFDHNQTGQLMSRATADVGTVRIFLSYGLLFFTQYIITIVGVLVVLLITDPLLSLVAIAVTPLIVWTAIAYSRRSHPILTQAQQTLADVTTQAEESGSSGVRRRGSATARSASSR